MLHHSFAFTGDEDIYQRNLTAITSLADLICLKLGIGTRQALEEIDLFESNAVKVLQLEESRLNLIKDAVAEHYLRDKGYFNAQ
jgi:hypothetical protein